MSERPKPLVEAASLPVSSPPLERVAYRTAIQPRVGSPDGYVQRKWRHAAAQSHAAMALEHRQLVETIRTTDGISKEQAELQVTAFEKQFKDDPL